MKIEGLTKLIEALRDRAAKAQKDTEASVVVGFTAAYAIYVHEDMEAAHPVGRAKFLEQPARDPERGKITVNALKRGKTMSQALLLEGLALQREAMSLCPVDTGNLRASAFTRLDVGAGTND